jgi:hypothetical protein
LDCLVRERNIFYFAVSGGVSADLLIIYTSPSPFYKQAPKFKFKSSNGCNMSLLSTGESKQVGRGGGSIDLCPGTRVYWEVVSGLNLSAVIIHQVQETLKRLTFFVQGFVDTHKTNEQRKKKKKKKKKLKKKKETDRTALTTKTASVI